MKHFTKPNVSTVILIVVMYLSQMSFAEYLVIQNPGFEDNVLGNDTSTPSINGWTILAGGSGNAGTFNPGTARFSDEAPQGSNTAFLDNRSISQLVPEVITVDTVYSLIVKVGDRKDAAYVGYEIVLEAGGSVVASDSTSAMPPNDGFATAVVNFVATPGHPNLNQIMTIRLSGSGLQTNMDAVRLAKMEVDNAIENLNQATVFASIQAAVNDADSGDVIEIPPGTYSEHIDLKGKSITLRSRSGDPNDTIIDGRFINTSGGAAAYSDLKGSIATCNNAESSDTMLQGLSLVNGIGRYISSGVRYGGGLYCNSASPTVSNCRFIDNTAREGAGVYNTGSLARFMDCHFEGNETTVHAAAMRNVLGSHVIISGCDFVNNNAIGFSGGAVLNTESSPVVTNCRFENNSCADRGGAYEDFDNSHSTITDCAFIGNHAGNTGGAIMNHLDCSPVITKCHFEKNSCLTEGGAVSNLTNCDPLISQCTFLGNQAATGGAIANRNNCSPVVGYSHFLANRASGSGGALFDINASSTVRSQPVYQHCRFIGNWCNSIGGVSNNNDFADAAFSHCVFLNNRAKTQGGALLVDNCRIHVTNCIARDNIAASNEDIEVNANAEALVRFCNVVGGIDGIGNIDADPNFVGAADDGGDGFVDDPATNGFDESSNNDYGDQHLTAGSPCIDAGISLQSAAVDLDGHVRAADDPDRVDSGIGAVRFVDMGAYEFNAPPAGGILGDLNGDGIVNFLDAALMAANWLTTL